MILKIIKEGNSIEILDQVTNYDYLYVKKKTITRSFIETHVNHWLNNSIHNWKEGRFILILKIIKEGISIEILFQVTNYDYFHVKKKTISRSFIETHVELDNYPDHIKLKLFKRNFN